MRNKKMLAITIIMIFVFITGCASSEKDKSAFAKPTINPNEQQKLKFVITTDKGVMKGILFPSVAPNTVLNFVTLVRKGFYKGLTFHRVVPGFVIQGGCPQGTGRGGPGYSIPAEFNKRPHKIGTLAMARAQHKDSAGSQFYICIGKDQVKHLDGKYTVFGQITEGAAVALKVGAGDKIKSIKIIGKLPRSLKGKEIKKSGIK